MKIAIIEALFYEDIAQKLAEGAIKKINELNAEYEIISVPGVLEIPTAISFAKKNYDGFVALGCVIRGETTHYDYVCEQSARALVDLSIHEKLAIGNGIITVENRTQAEERANIDKKDKGGFAANACIEMVNLKSRFK